MEPIDLALALLIVIAAIGAFDTLVNHDWRARLPARPGVAAELRLHALREGLWAALFLSMAHAAWLGAWSAWPAGLLAAIVLVDLRDNVVEARLRHIDAIERVTHALLWFTLGAFALMLGIAILADWQPRPAGVERVDHGWVGWLLTACGSVSGAIALRDGVASSRRPATDAAPRRA